MRKIICENCGKEYKPPPPEEHEEGDYREDYGIVKDLANFDGWDVRGGLFVFCPDCKTGD